MKIKLLFIVLLSSFILACNKDDANPENPPPANDGEVITTAILKFNDIAGILPDREFSFRDPDGEGGNPATQFDEIILQQSTQYECELILLNETLNPVDTISLEVLEEADEHLICYSVTGIPVDIIRTDSDGTFELGLKTLWTTPASAGTGHVRIVLKHQPGSKNGSCNPGDTDIDLTFNLIVE